MPASKKTTTTRKTTTKAPAKKVATPKEATPAEEVLDSNENTQPAEETQEVESFESAELAALKEELAKAKRELEEIKNHPTDATGRPLPEEELTPEQREIRALQDELARSKGLSLDSSISQNEEDFKGDGILIHVLEDGFTVAGQVRYRGEELVFGPSAYEDTKDRLGHSWLDLDDEGQYDRWGRVRFRRGPWPGKKKYDDEGAENKSIRSQVPVTQFS